MNQVSELVSVTGWRSERREVGWSELEDELGTPLPADFKELCEAFGRGAFSGFLEVLPVDGVGSHSLLGRWKSLKERAKGAQVQALFDPYQVFEGNEGLILWGTSMTEASYYWLADAAKSPETWPIVARTAPLEEWHRFDGLSTSQFIYRILTDREFLPFSLARKVEHPFFDAYR
ncbi:hypothetical protein [Streptomyces sp. TLI_105]|uniref:hypothetical protein n=1 Tax=Streptomyces sp. TLI_105 TaxID=1881019 RepID=UPI00089B5D13|nr:hypothetical protein [Streptomyces sp. TLI_105]SED95522.1 hypothetical protein SAMN05428939_6852 [Streptomyces sp. TLI_105]